MERITPSITNTATMKPCVTADSANSGEKKELETTPGAENKDTIAANIFRKYYEALLQGYSIDFFQGNGGKGSFHCT